MPVPNLVPVKVKQKIGVWIECYSYAGTCVYSDTNKIMDFQLYPNKTFGGAPVFEIPLNHSKDFKLEEKASTGLKLSTPPGSNSVALPWNTTALATSVDSPEKPVIMCGVVAQAGNYYNGQFIVSLPEWFVNGWVTKWKRSFSFRFDFTFGFTTGNEHLSDRQDQRYEVTLDVSSFILKPVERWSRAYAQTSAFTWVHDIIGQTITSVKFPDAKIVVRWQIPWVINDSTSDHNVWVQLGFYCQSYDNSRYTAGPYREVDPLFDFEIVESEDLTTAS